MKDTTEGKLTLKTRICKLWKSNSSPHEIALGMAIGVFIGITPFYGTHILTGVVAAFIIKRVNKLAIFLGMNVSLPWTIPFITWAGYSIGRHVLPGEYPPLLWKDFTHFSSDKFLEFFFVLTIGSLVLGTVLSILVYGITLAIFKRRTSGRLDPEAISEPPSHTAD